jgi:hypothetical protein
MRYLPILALILAPLLLPSPALAVSSAGCTQRSQKRSAAVVREFRREHPCPATGRTRGSFPGFQIDHMQPLCCGGADLPDNMHWLTTAEHRAKHAGGIVCIVGHETGYDRNPQQGSEDE